MSARDEILARVRGATADVVTTPADRGPTAVVEETSPGRAATLDLFAENVADYRAQVVRVAAPGVASAVAEALRQQGCATAVLPTGLDPAWRDAAAHVVRVLDEAEVAVDAELDAVDAVVTAAAVGIAVTGTVVLDHGPDQGRRALTLVPDVHVCVVRGGQVVHDVPEAVGRLRPEAGHARPLTWVSGPSATSDIELERVEGVHGPRTLVVVLVDEEV
ncbi:LUD domain-containing protein [Phycicoccus sp. MAQZ13P-2]|uniref:LutC/YkgG family protein n=1 Tax=Phycicoccus mangrovi TaxID=2840470 RepID=UPI001C000158|nr:LUD domain-containing protein [Phycicoccus mangrovi]MBT9255084.1 LUD domain-containing protein [Phycicoccus mangrovi]MBT9274068.1 LUD domain-containing protein [Phycicoccus mangrovi]